MRLFCGFTCTAAFVCLLAVVAAPARDAGSAKRAVVKASLSATVTKTWNTVTDTTLGGCDVSIHSIGSRKVVLKSARPTGDAAQKVAKELRDWVGKEIGPIAKPKDIRFGDNLPKTRSGKIMRRLLRSIAKGETITQDTSTLENPAILDQLKQSA